MDGGRQSAAGAPGSPDKLFYKIGEVSRMTGLEAYVLRYWESEFPFLHPRKSSGGQRVYTKKDVDLVLDIKRMLYEQGFTITGAKKQLQGRARLRREPPPPQTIGAIKGQLQSILDDLKAFDPLPSVCDRDADSTGGSQ